MVWYDQITNESNKSIAVYVLSTIEKETVKSYKISEYAIFLIDISSLKDYGGDKFLNNMKYKIENSESFNEKELLWLSLLCFKGFLKNMPRVQNNMIIITENLKLRPWKDSDAKCLYHFAKNPNIGPIAGWPPHESIEDSLYIIRTVFSKKETYAVVKDDIPIGCVGLLFHPDTNHWWGEGSVELGYWIAEEYWGRGYATEASNAVIERAFKEYGVKEIYASYRQDNPKSGRVLEKLGFKYYTDLTNTNYKNEIFSEVAMKLEK